MHLELQGIKIFDRAGKVKEDIGLPVGTVYRIEAMPDANIVVSGECTDSDGVTVNVPPGRYIVMVDFCDDRTGKRHYRNQYEENVGITDEQWQSLKDREPVLHGFVSTTKGPRFACKQFGCKHVTASRIEALLHEAKHVGMGDLLKKKDLGERDLIELQQKAQAQAEASRKVKASENVDGKLAGV